MTSNHPKSRKETRPLRPQQIRDYGQRRVLSAVIAYIHERRDVVGVYCATDDERMHATRLTSSEHAEAKPFEMHVALEQCRDRRKQ
jgi:hypothetical protein